MSDSSKGSTITFGWKKSVLYSLIPVVVLFGVLEGAARVIEIWVPPRQVDLGQGFDPSSRLFVPSPDNPDVMVTAPSKEVSFNHQEFVRTKPEGMLRIFALGGSSVKYLDYEFPLLAQRVGEALPHRFKSAEIINCGGLSYGTHRLVPIATEILEYDPDLVLIYSGHNEFEELEQLQLAELKSLPLQQLLSKSALCRFLRDRLAAYTISQLEEDHNKRLLADSVPDAGRTWNREFSPEEVQSRMENYENNLALIIQMCLERGVKVIIGTVPSNLIKPNLPGEEGTRYQEAADLFAKGDYAQGAELGRRILREATPRHQSSDRESEIVHALARRYSIPLADVEKAVAEAEPHHVPGETLFNDHCHLNPEGNKILAQVYEEQILRLF